MTIDKQEALVVITGITGYLGSQTCLVFLQNGYRVRGTVRSISSSEAKIKAAFGDDLFANLELVEADLNDEASISSACAGATYVIHTASPFHFGGDCVGPAVAGTTAAMKACTKHNVKMCVITSSCAAVLAPAKEDAPSMYDETCWSNPDRPEGLSDYMKSKTLAEKAAWDYQKANPGFDLSTICPTFIMGPSPLGDGTSIQWLKNAMNGSKSKIPRGRSGFVDVRDVALAHLRAIEIPEAANKRFILYNEKGTMPEIYGWLSKFNERGAKVPTTLDEGEDTGGDPVDNTRSKEVLKIEYTPLEKMFTDHAEQLISRGAI
mmetsp:Transcript_35298/g.77325  ORF Transcript_35298/g.77325 Transcript_35298/m.77325 type:complete len:320 (-) Transcript_35298:193-1152(-)|eukprot:CAMPEP_0178495372 /NCGR_PEP_ID=MMETSP0696-20121128/13509_1 /TAXON_ID=265572 /ORGANISM="Extubocellulus spinifer, Strain CCMP396" /LENGTH=319 /DNA_ID=CAMNT_0020123505 /DNA_START=115 /DNA_END=1074 /DNA_ORIENTATION=+